MSFDLKAALAIKSVYDGNCTNIGQTEFASSIIMYDDKPLQVLAIGGSDEIIDWVWNATLLSWCGVKLCSYLSAKKINKNFKRDLDTPLLVVGHSKSGPTAMHYKEKYGADYCIAFCPARGFRKASVIKDTTMYIDPNDIVPKLGALSFKHRICNKVYLKDDGFIKVRDHSINHVIEFLESKEEEKKEERR